MNLQKINIKIFAEPVEHIDLRDFFPVFNRWIQEKQNDELLLDVADYSLVPSGPGMMLIAHEANWQLEFGPEDRLGLRYAVKVEHEGSNVDRLFHAFVGAVSAVERFENDSNLPVPLNFNKKEFLITINSRIIAPNSETTLENIQTDLTEFLTTVFSGKDYQFEHSSKDPRERFSVVVKSDFEFRSLKLKV